MDEAFRRRYGMSAGSAGPPPPPAEPAAGPEAAVGAAPGRRPKAPGATNEISTINITFKAISWNSLFSEANKETASTMLGEIKNSPMFDAQETVIPGGGIENEEPPGVFSFKVIARLKRPLKL